MKRRGIIGVTVTVIMGLATASWAQSGGAGGGAGVPETEPLVPVLGLRSEPVAGTGMGSGTTRNGMNSNGSGMNSNGMNNAMMKSSTPGYNPGLNGNHSGPGGINTNNQ